MPPGSRITDSARHKHADNPIGPIKQGSENVFIGGLAAAHIGHTVVHDGGTCTIAKGSTRVFIDGLPAARIGDKLSCGGKIIAGFPDVIILG